MPLNKEDGNNLLDFYENLFTEKQRDVMEQFYRYDYSLSEIAENLNVSKSAISDLINRTDKQLLDYEDKLMLLNKYQKRESCYKKYLNENTKELIDALINLE